MAKTIEEFKALMESERGERARYEAASPDDTVNLPITRDGFEGFLAVVCKYMDLPVTNPLRNVLVGFMHHITNDICTTTIRAAGAALLKSTNNQCSWEIDQEVKKLANEEMQEERRIQMAAAAELEKEKKIQQALEKREKKADKRNGKSSPVVKRKTDEATKEKTN